MARTRRFPEWLDLRNFLAPRPEDFGLHRRKTTHDPIVPQVNGVSQDRRLSQNLDVMYRLYAVVVHIGSMVGNLSVTKYGAYADSYMVQLGGHYIAYTALPPDPAVANNHPSSSTSPKGHSFSNHVARRWCFVSDTSVRASSLEEVLKAKAYLCFYERVY